MEYNTTTGAWLNVENVKDGQKVKLINECTQVLSRFKNEKTGEPKMENQVKAQFQGMDSPVNMRLNWTTIYGLIHAFGKESKSWIGHTLTAMVKDATTGQSVYLIPEGYELVRNEEKRWTIKKTGGASVESTQPEYPEEIDPSLIPF